MKHGKIFNYVTLALLTAALSGGGTLAQDKNGEKKDAAAAGQPSESEMMAKMMELAKTGEHHKVLEASVGTWNYQVKMWMSPDPSAPPSTSSGRTVTRAVMGGRYFISDHSGMMQMPGMDGKMSDVEFKGMAIEGYDNVKQKYVASWIDNMGTGIMLMEGTYDDGAKTFTYIGEEEPMPGMKTKFREIIKNIDPNHRTFQWYEDRGGKEVKTMEISFSRQT
ncbi:conserved exported hypothetical protein [Verrucomicrobia bacterium]|nr:conserved exported hypothetical protein [Verrucomicrobiota bacterium]